MTDVNRKPPPERDPGSRRRLDGEAMRARDAKVAKLLAARVPYATIAKLLHMSTGSVQKAATRIRSGTVERSRKVRVPAHKSRFASADEKW